MSQHPHACAIAPVDIAEPALPDVTPDALLEAMASSSLRGRRMMSSTTVNAASGIVVAAAGALIVLLLVRGSDPGAAGGRLRLCGVPSAPIVVDMWGLVLGFVWQH